MFDVLTRQLFATPPRETLYHYTSLTGVLGIVGSAELRASDIRYMNDSTELRHTLDLLGRQGLAIDVDLDAPAHVLQHHERPAVEHDAPGDLDRNGGRFQLFLGLLGVLFLQVACIAVATEVVGEGIALLTHGSKLFLALGNQLVFFLLQFVLVELLVAHGRFICLASRSNGVW